MGLTEFQTKKILNLFENLYDTNKDGVVDKSDFDECLEKIKSLHNWGKDEGAYKSAQDTLNKIWENLKTSADVNKDGTITKEEWTKMWEGCIKDVVAGKGFPAWQQDYMEFMFFANDTNGDDLIDREEYTAVYKLLGYAEADLKLCFDKISEGCKDQMLNKTDFQALWKEYFTSEDENAKGNFLFGRQKH